MMCTKIKRKDHASELPVQKVWYSVPGVKRVGSPYARSISADNLLWRDETDEITLCRPIVKRVGSPYAWARSPDNCSWPDVTDGITSFRVKTAGANQFTFNPETFLLVTDEADGIQAKLPSSNTATLIPQPVETIVGDRQHSCNQSEATEDSSMCSTADHVTKPDTGKISIVEMVLLSASIVLSIIDVGADICVTQENHTKYYDTDPAYFILGVLFIAVSGFLSFIFSFWWYYAEANMKPKDSQRRVQQANNTGEDNRHDKWKIYLVVQFFFSLVSLGSVLRKMEALRCAWQNRRASKTSDREMYFKESIRNSNSGHILLLFETIFESIPQLCLQIYIMIIKQENTNSKITLTILSLFAIPMSFMPLNESGKFYRKDAVFDMLCYKKDENSARQCNISGCCRDVLWRKLFYVLWRLCEIFPRMVVVAAFATRYSTFLLIGLAIHSLLSIAMALVLAPQKRMDPSSKMNTVRLITIGFAWNFCFINPQDTGKSTSHLRIIYYAVFILENIAMVVAWQVETHKLQLSWTNGITAVVTVPILLMAVFQFIFYYLYHPSVGRFGYKSRQTQSLSQPDINENLIIGADRWRRERRTRDYSVVLCV